MHVCENTRLKMTSVIMIKLIITIMRLATSRFLPNTVQDVGDNMREGKKSYYK